MDSDPNKNSFVRVWGAPSRTAEGKRRGAQAYLEALIAGKGQGEDRTNGAAARPVVAAGEGRASEERVREKGKL